MAGFCAPKANTPRRWLSSWGVAASLERSRRPVRLSCGLCCGLAVHASDRPRHQKCRRVVTRDVLNAVSYCNDAERSRGKATSLRV